MSQGQLPRTFGDYQLVKLLAKGGMGEIYLARTLGINQFEKYYALKRLLEKFAHDPDVSARFIDEARLGARLQHPNIVQVYDLGVCDDELYMATEFVDGFDLRRVLRYCHETKKRIPLDVALFMVREILSGLAYAHRQVDAEGRSINLIHRDISPQNVLVSFEGEVKIIDFGLAKSTQRSQETQANVLLGNFGYMSPEQARGQRLDVRTDVYSTGVVLFELVTGTKRFIDENPMRLLEMVAQPAPIFPSERAPDVPKAIDRIYAGATAAAREDRYQTAERFRDEVTAALHQLNPRASREHLAQFLSHLFLGGAALPAVDNDVLNQSVAVQVQDLLGGTAAFSRPKEHDSENRDLAAFSDDMPQTGSHPLMRAAGEGDLLTHQELTDPAPEAAPESFLPVSSSGLAAPAPGRGPTPASPPPAAPPPAAPTVVVDFGAEPVTAPGEPREGMTSPGAPRPRDGLSQDDSLIVDIHSQIDVEFTHPGVPLDEPRLPSRASPAPLPAASIRPAAQPVARGNPGVAQPRARVPPIAGAPPPKTTT